MVNLISKVFIHQPIVEEGQEPTSKVRPLRPLLFTYAEKDGILSEEFEQQNTVFDRPFQRLANETQGLSGIGVDTFLLVPRSFFVSRVELICTRDPETEQWNISYTDQIPCVLTQDAANIWWEMTASRPVLLLEQNFFRVHSSGFIGYFQFDTWGTIKFIFYTQVPLKNFYAHLVQFISSAHEKFSFLMSKQDYNDYAKTQRFYHCSPSHVSDDFKRTLIQAYADLTFEDETLRKLVPLPYPEILDFHPPLVEAPIEDDTKNF